PVFPAASRATAVRVWEPLPVAVVSHVIEYGAVVSSGPRLDPSSLNWTPTTPTSSTALAATVTGPDTVEPEVGEVMATVGGTVSGTGPGGGAGLFETVTVTGEEVPVLPAASRATAVRVWEPLEAVVVSQVVE